MYIYLLVVMMVITTPWIMEIIITNKEVSKKISFKITMILIFFLFALKAPTVGRDILGYKKVYDYMVNATWTDFDVCWMEWGYEFLMMIFVHIFHFKFQTFMIAIYAFVFWSYYNFIKKYSNDYTTSMLIYICFTFSTFDMSAVRNMLAVAICLRAYVHLEKFGKKEVLKFIFLVIMAAQIHTAAYVFLLALPLIKLPINAKTILLYTMTVAGMFVFRDYLYVIVNTIRDVSMEGIDIGGNTIMYLLFVAFSVVIISLSNTQNKQYVRKMQKINFKNKEIVEKLSHEDIINPLKMVLTGVCLLIFSSVSVLIRLAQFFQFFIIVLLPNSVARLNFRTRVIAKLLIYIFLVVYYWKYALSVNSLDIIPYKFFF